MLFGTGLKLVLSTSSSIAIDGKALNRVSEYNINSLHAHVHL